MYVTDNRAGVRFLPLPPPDDAEVAWVTTRVARRIGQLLERRGLGHENEVDPEEVDALSRDEPLLAALYSASVRGRIATGPRAGRRVTRFGDHIDVEDGAASRGPRCAEVAGISVHANVAVPARDRERLEELQPDYDYAGPDRLAYRDDHTPRASVARRDGDRSARLRPRGGLRGAWPRRSADHPACLDIVTPARIVSAC